MRACGESEAQLSACKALADLGVLLSSGAYLHMPHAHLVVLDVTLDEQLLPQGQSIPELLRVPRGVACAPQER